MRAGGREWFAVTAVFGLWIGACLDSGDKDNDNTGSPVVVDAGSPGGTTGGTGGTTGGTGGTTGGTGGTTGGTGGTTGGTGGTGGTTGGTGGTTGGTGGTTGGTGGTTGGTGGTTGGTGGTGGTTGGGASKVAGTGNACLSTGAPANGKCGSYYCGVDMATLTAELTPGGACADNPTYACVAELTAITTKCTVDKIVDLAVPVLLEQWDMVETVLKTCVKENPGVISNNVKEPCVNCFVTAAMCCVKNSACQAACTGLATSSPECDAAQKTAGCIDPVFPCGGLPRPF